MRTITGKVISDKIPQTVVVEVNRLERHPMYRKQMRRTKNFHAHNDKGAKTGDTVKLTEIKPMSKTKFWKVAEIVK
jgi:small subunit ribosomal protein S17